MRLLEYVIMEKHLHLIATRENVSKEVGDFKSYTARRIIDRLRETAVEKGSGTFCRNGPKCAS
jgi:putative transposase